MVTTNISANFSFFIKIYFSFVSNTPAISDTADIFEEKIGDQSFSYYSLADITLRYKYKSKV